jgi:hypothetical protein
VHRYLRASSRLARGREGFEYVLDLVEEASEGLLEEIKEKHVGAV